MSIKKNCDGCGAKLGDGNGYGAKSAARPWWVCGCGVTTYLDTNKEYVEWRCKSCGNLWNSVNPETCPNCAARPVLQEFVRCVSISEIETMMQ